MTDFTSLFANVLKGIEPSKELQRILTMPRRDPIATGEALVHPLTCALRTDAPIPLNAHGKPVVPKELRYYQALALAEAKAFGGALIPLPVGAGKAQPVDEPVLTPTGWRAIGDLRAGDRVIGSAGTPVTVRGVFPQGARDVYRVTMTDATWTRCCGAHLWDVRGERGGKGVKRSVRTVDDLRTAGLRKASGHKGHRWFVPMVAPVAYPHADLPIDPYTLGALLGDGGMSQNAVQFTTMDVEILAQLRLPPGVRAVATQSRTSGRATQYNLTSGRYGGPGRNALLNALRDLGLIGKRSEHKHVPAIYRYASAAQRLALLQGLFDTDGHAANAGACEFSTASHQLAEHVREIVQSLGGTAARRPAKRTTHLDAYRFHVKLPAGVRLFRLPRKQHVADVARQREPYRAITSIEPDGRAECVCISVDAPDQLYVTRDHILTHNTLITFLLPYVFGDVPSVLLVPAKLREKTQGDFDKLRPYWRGGTKISVVSYELLSNRKDLLLQLGPKLIMADECHMLKNPRSGRKKRVWRYFSHYPETAFVALTGTVQKKGFVDWHHIQRGALPPELHVLPDNWDEMIEWDQALGPAKKQRRPLGALSRLAGPQGGDYEVVRQAFGERFRMTPGVITCPGGSCDASLVFELERVRHPEIESKVALMRDTWETPNGVPFTEASQLWAHARECANGYELIWRVPGPPEWMDARREANAFVRETLKHSRKLDTELEVYRAHPHAPELVRWRQIKPSFIPEPIAVWFSYDLIDLAVERARRDNALIWVEHVTAGETIRERHGLPYFGRGGVCSVHGSILNYAGGPCAVSVTAVREGFNLQDRWSRSLYLNIPPGVVEYEQSMGRTHRQGQSADVVEYTQLWVVDEQRDGFMKALDQARAAQDTDSQAKKLCLADIVIK